MVQVLCNIMHACRNGATFGFQCNLVTLQLQAACARTPLVPGLQTAIADIILITIRRASVNSDFVALSTS